MTSAGRILIMPKGNYDSGATYEMLDLVFHGGSSWVAKKTAKGIEPSVANAEYWMLMCSGTDITTLEQRMAALEASFINLANEEDIDLSEYAKQSALDALTVNMQNLGLAVNGLSTELEGVKNTLSGLPTKFANVQVLSRKGVGTFGSADAACSVTADFEVKVLLFIGYKYDNGLQMSPTGNACTYTDYAIMCDALTTEYKNNIGFCCISTNGAPTRYAKKSADGKTIYWYIAKEAGFAHVQLNQQETTYYFLAIG